MTAVALSKPEIIARLMELHSTIRAVDVEITELLTQLQRPQKDTVRPIELTFGKNLILWGNGHALVIRGKGYNFIRALYHANGMRLKEKTLGKIVWQDEMPDHHNFKEFIRKTAIKLEKTQFPYRLIPIKSKGRIHSTGKTRNGKPEMIRVQSEVIGARLDATKLGAKVPSD
jgi:DNA-binding response OmpR family regulator